MKPIPYGKQSISDDDIQTVVETLRSDFLTQGPKIAEFEALFASYVGSTYAVAVSNGTAALHLSVLAFGIQPGDKVITSPITFSASANCIRYCGGEVVFCDIDPETLLLDVNQVKRLLEKSPKGTYKGIVPVDFAGRAVNLEEFRELADLYDLWILEDACHAPGGFFTDRNGNVQKCGNGKFAEAAIFSFHPVKHIATGEGGMITTNSKAIFDKLMVLRTHGISRDPDLFENSVSLAVGSHDSVAEQYPAWYMEMITLGYNYRLSDFQAALGISQLKRADQGLARRRALARRYDEAFSGHSKIKSLALELGLQAGKHAYHLYVIQVPQRLELYNYLRQNNIFPQVHYIPVHLMPYYKNLGWKPGDMPKAESYYSQCLSIPMYPTLTEDEQAYVIQKILGFYAS
jgi:UDP-4-amino-4,6-dideoxy-N-acetyl-beta-L-altrosamine transaminase